MYIEFSILACILIYKLQDEVGLARATYKYWRQARKLLDRGLRPAVIASYRPLQQRSVHVLLARLLANPNDLEAHLA
jgi:cytochrome P450